MRVLFLTHRLPYAPNRGDRVRAYHVVRALADRTELEIVSLVHDRDELSNVKVLRGFGVKVAAFPIARTKNLLSAIVSLPGTRPLTHALLNAPGIASEIRSIVVERRPDVVLAYCSGMARFALHPALAKTPLVLDFVDVDSDKWGALAVRAPALKRWLYQRESGHLARFERLAALHAHTSLVVNERERESLRRLAPTAAVRVLPNGVDVNNLRPSSEPSPQPTVVFCGVMNYEPNIEGVLWFARDVWPIIVSHLPQARFTVVGSNPSRAIRRLPEEFPSIEVTGTVADVRSYLWNAAVSVAPLKTARGLQNKVLEALAAGLPTVITSMVADGLPRGVHSGCRVADDPSTFAEQTLALLALSGTERRAIAARADLAALSWESQLGPLLGILEEAASAPHANRR